MCKRKFMFTVELRKKRMRRRVALVSDTQNTLEYSAKWPRYEHKPSESV